MRTQNEIKFRFCVEKIKEAESGKKNIINRKHARRWWSNACRIFKQLRINEFKYEWIALFSYIDSSIFTANQV